MGITMKYSAIIAVLLTVLLATDAEAQFRRRDRKKQERNRSIDNLPDRRPSERELERQKEREERERERETKREEQAARQKPKRKLEVVYPDGRKKDVYRIDVLVPLYLDELVKNNKPAFKGKLPEKAIPGLDFYQGLKLAADTLEFKKYNFDIYVHDITSPSKTVKSLIARGTLDSSDLIIGAVQAAEIPMLAEVASRRNINFISALSPSDGGVHDNPFFTIIQPRLQTHCEWIMKKIAEKYHKEQITILYRTSAQGDENAYSYLTNILEENDLRKLSCNTVPDSAQLAKAFDSTETNVIIMPIIDDGYAESILRKLYKYFPAYKFAVYGMPSWKSMPGIRKPEAFPNVAVYFTTPFYFDPTTTGAQMLYSSYQNKFNGKPSEMVFRGFETLYWYATLLRDHGTIFNGRVADNDKAPFTKFEIRTNWDKKREELLYNENQHLYLYRYQSSSYMIEQ
jgi:hypothetical protein